jgi:FKBP-type peptidyl-prolyl cis-trans isomerase FklB
MGANPGIFNYKHINDTIKGHGGCYYQSLSPAIDTSIHFPIDTTIYINYTCKLLNGLVFDTSIEKVAKDNGLYSASRTYGPVQIHWNEDYKEITMGEDGSSVIGGFALTLAQMHPMEKGVGVFTSDYGYSYSGSGASIPPYAPLVFEIEIVAKPEE